MKKILFILGLAALGMVSCTIDEHFRSDTMTSTQLKSDPTAAVYTTDGVYTLFKDELEYKGNYASGCTYVRHFFQMSEFRGDNATLSGKTTDPLYQEFCYNDDGTLKNNQTFWWIAYRIIFSANSNIEAIDENSSDEAAHMKGENYFMRAIAHFNLVNIYAQPLACGGNNPGVVLRTSTDTSKTEKATVQQVYDQVVLDLQEAARLMKGRTPRGDKGYISYEAAMGLLSRVYLYMEQYDLVIETVNTMLGGAAPRTKLDDNYETLFTNACASNEVLWCVAHTDTENKDTGSIGSMYFSPNGTGGIGWGEIYWSDPLLELIRRYPQDLRYTTQYWLYDSDPHDGNDRAIVHWPTKSDKAEDFNRMKVTVPTAVKNADGKWEFKSEGKTYVVEHKDKNSDGYMETYIKGNPTGAEVDKDGDVRVYVTENVNITSKDFRYDYPQYMMKKFSNQNNKPNLSSPIMVRWGEVILNRAEAHAELGHDADALADVNAIRNRAGIPEWNDSDHKWSDHYTDIVDVVLDERRLELCFEGHRAFDVWRKRQSMDRRFAGSHPWEVVDYTDPRIPYQIPLDEINVSDIAQNPREGK